MTTLSLESTWLAPVSDLSDTLELPQYSQSQTDGARTEIRTYAGGRRRVVSRPGETLTISVAYRFITRAQYANLLDLLGGLVLFRDQFGRAVYGLLSDVSGTESASQQTLVEDVSFTITEVSYSEVV